MKKTITLILSFILIHQYKSQNLLHCGSDEMRISTLKKNPKIAQAVIKRDQQLEAFTQQYVDDFYQKKTATATYIIPVVFHVIHTNGSENISDAQIKDGIDILNKTFRKQLADTASIVSVFKSLHADCDIEFRLAQKDPNGNCHSGINRIVSPLTETGDHSVKKLIHWPPNQYLNIYIVKNAAGLAGHCVWPSDADTIPEWDGIVIGYNYVGSIGASNYTQSVALAHECGHYLNLHHIWGGNNVPNFYYYPCADPNKDCNIDDLVADTPPTIGWQTCNLNGASCGNTVDNVQNTMDYSYCNRMFTYGQKARMHACLNSSIAGRNNLWQSSNLIATGVSTPVNLCASDFMANKQVVCQNSGNQIVFTNTAYNSTYTATYWDFPGGTPSSSSVNSPTVTYTTPGIYPVSLKVKNNTDSVMLTKSNFITVLANTGTQSYPFSESFESTSNLNGTTWYASSLDTLNTFILTNTAAFSGQKSVMVPMHHGAGGSQDELYSQIINLTGAPSLNISFKYAFARRDTGAVVDNLKLMIANNCNGTWITRATITGTTLTTANSQASSYIPSGNWEWKAGSGSIPTSYLTSGFRFKFVLTTSEANNFYLDDINLDVGAGITELSEILTNLDLFPNPVSDQLNLRFELSEPKQLEIEVFNVLGQSVYNYGKSFFSSGDHQISIKTQDLSTGMYFLKISDHGRQINKTFIIN